MLRLDAARPFLPGAEAPRGEGDLDNGPTLSLPRRAEKPWADGPLVSVIITNYNYGRFVGDAIRSCLAQSYSRIECVVVDDGSTDESREVIAGFPEVVSVLKENGGQASAARAGLSASRGDILMFLDSDDFLHPDACASVVEAWQPDASAVVFALEVQRAGRPTGERLPSQPFLTGGHLSYAMRYGWFPCAPTSGNAFARSYVETLFRQAIHMDGNCFDAYLLYSAAACGRILTVDRVLGTYRIHDDNISLVNSANASRVAAHIYYQYWAQQTLSRVAKRPGAGGTRTSLLKGPYHLRWYLMTRDQPPGRFSLPPMPRAVAVLAGIRQSAVWPAMTLNSRLRNIAVIALFGLLPRPLRLRLSARLAR